MQTAYHRQQQVIVRRVTSEAGHINHTLPGDRIAGLGKKVREPSDRFEIGNERLVCQANIPGRAESTVTSAASFELSRSRAHRPHTQVTDRDSVAELVPGELGTDPSSTSHLATPVLTCHLCGQTDARAIANTGVCRPAEVRQSPTGYQF